MKQLAGTGVLVCRDPAYDFGPAILCGALEHGEKPSSEGAEVMRVLEQTLASAHACAGMFLSLCLSISLALTHLITEEIHSHRRVYTHDQREQDERIGDWQD